jgi:hypothetical protein
MAMDRKLRRSFLSDRLELRLLLVAQRSIARRVGWAKRNPPATPTKVMGFASLNPSYGYNRHAATASACPFRAINEHDGALAFGLV